MATSFVRGLVASVMVLAMTVGRVDGLASTDTITWGGDNSRSGYFPNNNMDPAVVTSSDFGQVFKVQLPGNYGGERERIFSQPLIYTPTGGDGTQYVYWATAQNNVYKMNAKTGEIVASRNLHIPFLSADLTAENSATPGYCQDINPVVGIIGTGVIDPDTDTLYLAAKTYENQDIINKPQGRPAGRIYVHAIDVNTLKERPNFPINLEGMAARNNPARLFNGGIQNQRPGLLHPKGSNFVYAGFGSHCVNYNFTGWVVGWDKTTGEIVERYATQGEGVSNQKKGASLWMSGGGIASDDKGSMFFSTGNGYSEQVKDIPIAGGTPPTSLEEAIVHMTFNETGQVRVIDFYMPANKGYLDGGDLDLGTSPLAMLPTDPFSCGSIRRMGVITGKDRMTYFVNLDDLGGYKTGPNMGNRVLGNYYNENSVYSGAGVYPLEGGYIHINVNGFPSVVFKFDCINNKPVFTKVANANPQGKNGFGVGHGTITSLNGKPGTGLSWVADQDNNNPEGYSFRIYEAVPTGNAGTVAKLLKGFTIPSINKFTRPHFGDGIAYFGTSVGTVYAYGAPTNPALSCSAVDDFGTVNVGVEAAVQTVTCTAKGALRVTELGLESADFSVSDGPTLPLTLSQQGQSFTFKARFKPSRVGSRSGTVVIKTTNNVAGFASTTSVRLSGTAESADALLAVSPRTLSFTNVVVGSEPQTGTIVVENEGLAALQVQSVQYSETGPDGPYVTPGQAPVVNGTTGGAAVGHYTVYNMPSSLASGVKQAVTVSFDPSAIGKTALYVKLSTNGGNAVFSVTASVGASPVASFQLEKADGSGWQTWDPKSPDTALSFGNVTQNTNRRLRFRIVNTAPEGSVSLQLPISKPPFGVPGLINSANQADLSEGTVIPAGGSVEAVIICTAPKKQWNTDSYTNRASWIFNTNDVTLGKVQVPFTCTATAQQGGPLQADKQGTYRYVGCFRENNPGRQLKQQLYGNNNNTADMCLQACAAKGFAYCGTQYHRECWGGPAPPVQQAGEENCNFDCSGDIGQYCGGNGVNAGAGNAHISLWATNATLPNTPAPGGPYVNPGLNGYTSMGCYTESTGQRVLANAVSTNNVRTVASCINACAKLNYKYIGLQYGGECWCANEFRGDYKSAPMSECSVTCRDNATEYCGGGQRLNVYQKAPAGSVSTSSLLSTLSSTSSTSVSVSVSSTSSTAVSATSSASSSVSSSVSESVSSTSTSSSVAPSSTVPVIKQTVGAFRYQGCYTETTEGGRSLAGKSYYNDTMTLEDCANACDAFTYWGAEYGRECFCGNELRGNTLLEETSPQCSFLCPGDKLTFCGGNSRLSVYKYDPSLNATASSSTSLASSVAFDAATSTSSVASSSVATPSSSTPSSSATSSSVATPSSSVVTPSSSVAATSSSAASSSDASSSSVASSAASSSSAISSSSASSSAASSSSASSSAASSSSAVSSSTISSSSTSSASSSASSSSAVSSTATSTTSTSASSTSAAPSATVSAPLWPGNKNFTYYGCAAEPSSGRLLTKLMWGADDATHNKCLEACRAYDYAGLEYGRECWCGNAPINWKGNTGATPGFNATETDCKMGCSGNSTQKCGGSKRMTLFYFDKEKASKSL
jgi:hypothetical protein